MSFEILSHAGRTRVFQVSLYEADGSTAVVLGSGDVVRCKIGRGAATPDLDLDSVADASGGSGVTVDTLDPGVVTVRLAQSDTTDLLGVYDVEIGIVDDSETDPADAFKTCAKGVLHVLPGMGGDVAKT